MFEAVDLGGGGTTILITIDISTTFYISTISSTIIDHFILMNRLESSFGVTEQTLSWVRLVSK